MRALRARGAVVSVLIDEPLVLLWSAVEPLVLEPAVPVLLVPVLLLSVALGLGEVCDPPVDVVLLGLVEVLELLVPVPALVPVLVDELPPVLVCATAMPTAATRTADAAATVKPLGNWLILKLLIPVDARPEADGWATCPRLH